MSFISRLFSSVQVPDVKAQENDHSEESEGQKNEEEDDKDEPSACFLQKLIYTNGCVSYYISDARDLCLNVIVWSSNRNLNQQHINSLEKDIRLSKTIIGSFKLVRDKKDQIRLFDGQHRLYALQNILKTDTNFHMEILIELYDIDDIDSSKAIQLFSQANNVKSVAIADMPNIIAHETVKQLSELFPNAIREVDIGKKVNRPNISKRMLYEQIKSIIEENSQRNLLEGDNNYPKTIKELIDSIKRMNLTYSLRKMEQFRPAVTQAMYKKAKSSGFYLGLDKEISTWLNRL